MARPAAPALSPPELLIGAAVDGTAGWRAVRSVLTDPQRHGAGRLLASPGRGPHPQAFELVRSKLKPGRKLTAYYRSVRAPGPVSAHVAVSWSSDGRVSLLRFPEDPVMPQLARLSDGLGLAALVESFHAPLAGPVPELHVVRYQPGQRHVLVARSARWPSVYVKTDRDDRGASAVPLAGVLATALARDCPSACVAEPLGHVPAERASLWWRAPGRPVAVLVARGRSATPLVAQAGRAARAIHDGGTSSVRPQLPFPDARAEAAATLRAGAHIVALLPSLGRTYQRLVADVIDALDRLPDEPPTLVHGDLKAENLLAAGPRLRLLDLDRVCLAEPAHDLGKFLADLRWWSPAADVATLEAALRDGYGACDPLRWRRAELLAVLLQLRLVARRASLHDGRWPDLVRDRTRRAVVAFELAGRR